MGFNYDYTCPTIDEAIEMFKSSLTDELLATEKFDGKEIDNIVEKVYFDTEAFFEGVRDSNSNMREEAEDQIEDLEKKISDSEEEKEGYIDTIKDLESVIKDLQGELSYVGNEQ
jgi:hypothetical protein